MARVLFSEWFSIQGIIQNTTCSVCFRFSILLKNIQGIIQCLVHYSGYYSKYDLQRLVHYSGYYSKMVRVLFNVCFIIKGIIQNTTCSVWFRIQGIIQNTTCSVWCILQGIIQKWLGIIRVLFSVCFCIQGIIQNTTCSVWFRIQGIIEKYPGYYSASGLLFRVLFKIRPAASGSGFRVLLKNIQGIIQHLVYYSGYYSKYDLQHLVQDSAYYSKYDLQRLVHYSGYYSKYDLQRLVHYSG